jgi:hypothetical protein
VVKHTLRAALAAVPLLLLFAWIAVRATMSPEERLRAQVEGLVEAFNLGDTVEMAELLGSGFSLEPGDLDELDFEQLMWSVSMSGASLSAELEPDSFRLTPDALDRGLVRVGFELHVRDLAAGADADAWVVSVLAEARDRGRGFELHHTKWAGHSEPPAVDLSGGGLPFTSTVRILSPAVSPMPLSGAGPP